MFHKSKISSCSITFFAVFMLSHVALADSIQIDIKTSDGSDISEITEPYAAQFKQHTASKQDDFTVCKEMNMPNTGCFPVAPYSAPALPQYNSYMAMLVKDNDQPIKGTVYSATSGPSNAGSNYPLAELTLDTWRKGVDQYGCHYKLTVFVKQTASVVEPIKLRIENFDPSSKCSCSWGEKTQWAKNIDFENNCAASPSAVRLRG